MSELTAALNAACVLLTEDHHLVEAFSASRRGRVWFRPDYDRDLVETSAHLDAKELMADQAANRCANVGLTALADCCQKVAQRIALAKRQGTDDRDAVPDMSRLTTTAREALCAAEFQLSA